MHFDMTNIREWEDSFSKQWAKKIGVMVYWLSFKNEQCVQGESKKKKTMKEITSGSHYITSLRLLIKHITCFSAVPVILHKCVVWLPFIMCNCSMLQRCHGEYLLWIEYLVKIFGKIPETLT